MNLIKHRILFPLFFFLTFSLSQVKAQKLAVTPYACCTTGDEAVDVQNCGDDRLFVLDRSGIIQVINPDGTFRPTPFLDITSKIFVGSDEETLVGLAFSPDYKTNGKFYVNYVGNVAGTATSIIEEYKVSAADSNIADPASALTIITQTQPYDIHKGGNLMFDKEGYLYINLGDGGSPEDADGNAQNKTNLLGKILRIDVRNSSVAQPYVIPSSNPFYNDNTAGIRKEIWAYGLRNPWRASIDKLTGDRLFTDVGQNAEEEVDFEVAGSAGGKNYGWNTMEGNVCFSPMTGCNTTGLALPTYTYPHPVGAAIIGGYVCRSAQSKALFGTYIFVDLIDKWIDGIKIAPDGTVSDTVHLLTTEQNTIGYPLSMGQDRYGDLYLLYLTHKTVFKITDTSSTRRPKAYFSPLDQGTGSFLFQGLQGRNLTYQWLRDNVPVTGATSPDYIASENGTYTLVVTNTLGFSDTSDPFTLGALSLNLTSFTAQKIAADKVGLEWTTASERNVAGFSIMRKQNNEANFSSIGFVNSKAINGNSGSELNYAFTDSSALTNAKIFYRLQIQNKDGSFTWSDIRVITTGGRKNNFTYFPNPARGQVQIYLDSFVQPVVMVIYDNAGKKVRQLSLNQQSNIVELEGLRGLYIIQVSNKDGSNVIRKKLVIRD